MSDHGTPRWGCPVDALTASEPAEGPITLSPSLLPAARYRGRFAPSPTGPLHFGSLIAALGSYLDARSQGGQWLVRIEDIDHQRTRPRSANDILQTLDAFGFEWDGDVDFQSRRLGQYRRATQTLLARGLAYSCICSRREVAESGRMGPDGPVYPGTCRAHPGTGTGPRSLRLRTDPIEVAVEDRVQGPIRQQMARDIGDFVVHRADGVYAYQLAVVVDDADQGITDVVRGADLLLSTPRQVYLQQVLGLPTLRYAHLPVAVDAQGRKLSKSDAATPVDRSDPLPALLAAWAFLGQDPPPQRPGNRQAFWAWARARWRLDRVPSLTARPIAEVTPPRQRPPLKAA